MSHMVGNTPDTLAAYIFDIALSDCEIHNINDPGLEKVKSNYFVIEIRTSCQVGEVLELNLVRQTFCP